MAIASINPATGETLRTFDSLSEPQIDTKLQRAADTFRAYRRTTFAERARMMVPMRRLSYMWKRRVAPDARPIGALPI